MFTKKNHGRILTIKVFSADGHCNRVPSRLNTIASRDQLRIRESLLVNYND